MNLWEKYLRPSNVEEALAGMASAPVWPARLPGGTDLLLDLKQGRHAHVHTLVDMTTIPELTTLEIRADELFIGAAVPLSHIVASELVQEHAQALIEASQLVGGPQVRNTATLGGNVAHALPAADGTIALMVLQVQAEIADLQGRRRVPVADLSWDPGNRCSTWNANCWSGSTCRCAKSIKPRYSAGSCVPREPLCQSLIYRYGWNEKRILSRMCVLLLDPEAQLRGWRVLRRLPCVVVYLALRPLNWPGRLC